MLCCLRAVAPCVACVSSLSKGVKLQPSHSQRATNSPSISVLSEALSYHRLIAPLAFSFLLSAAAARSLSPPSIQFLWVSLAHGLYFQYMFTVNIMPRAQQSLRVLSESPRPTFPHLKHPDSVTLPLIPSFGLLSDLSFLFKSFLFLRETPEFRVLGTNLV